MSVPVYRKPWLRVVEEWPFPDFVDRPATGRLNVGEEVLLISATACYAYSDLSEDLGVMVNDGDKMAEPFAIAARRDDAHRWDGEGDERESVYWVFKVLRRNGEIVEADFQHFEFI